MQALPADRFSAAPDTAGLTLMQRYDLIASAGQSTANCDSYRPPTSAAPGNTEVPLYAQHRQRRHQESDQTTRPDVGCYSADQSDLPARRTQQQQQARSAAPCRQSAVIFTASQHEARGEVPGLVLRAQRLGAGKDQQAAGVYCPVHRHPCAPLLLRQDGALASCIDMHAGWSSAERDLGPATRQLCTSAHAHVARGYDIAPAHVPFDDPQLAGVTGHTTSRHRHASRSPDCGADARLSGQLRREGTATQGCGRRQSLTDMPPLQLQCRIEQLESELRAARDEVRPAQCSLTLSTEPADPVLLCVQLRSGSVAVCMLLSSPAASAGATSSNDRRLEHTVCAQWCRRIVSHCNCQRRHLPPSWACGGRCMQTTAWEHTALHSAGHLCVL